MRLTKKPRKLYDVYNNGKYLFTGNLDTIAAHLKIHRGTVRVYVNADESDEESPIVLIPVEGTDLRIYSYYKGDELLAVGNVFEISEQLGIRPDTVYEMSSRKRAIRGKALGFSYAIPLDLAEVEQIYAENMELEGFRVFTSCTGRVKKVYKLFKDDVYQFSGTVEHIAEHLGYQVSSVYGLLGKDGQYRTEIDKSYEKRYAIYDSDKNLQTYGYKQEVLDKLGITSYRLDRMLANRFVDNDEDYAVPMCKEVIA